MEIEIRNAEALGECYAIINEQRERIEQLEAELLMLNDKIQYSLKDCGLASEADKGEKE